MKKMYCLVVTDDFSRFSWVFFLSTKDETSEILKTFITGIENLIDLKVKMIRYDNRTKFKNRVMNQLCEMNGTDNQEKDEKQRQNDKTGLGMEKTVKDKAKSKPESTKACDNAGKARMETIPGKDYILLPLSIQDPPFSSSLKHSPDAGFKPSGEEDKKNAEDPRNEDSEVPSIEEPIVNQEKDASINTTNTNNIVSPTVNTAGIEDNVVD
ncbi:putative ribonuclease H-like domain-containing protein [Tanacetum coccineum]